MNTNVPEGEQLASEVVNMVGDELMTEVTVIIIPPFTHVTSTQRLAAGSKVAVGVQNCSEHDAGAYTGEISVSMIKSTGAQYVVIGHSERREYFGESDTLLASKTTKVLAAGLTPIFCCGEKLEVREAGDHFDLVASQVKHGLFHLDADQLRQTVIAYEPVWAIGTGVTASSGQAQEMHAHIRAEIAKAYDADLAAEISILYGGSVKPSNAEELFACPDVDGGLVGGASLDARGFVDIAKSFT